VLKSLSTDGPSILYRLDQLRLDLFLLLSLAESPKDQSLIVWTRIMEAVHLPPGDVPNSIDEVGPVKVLEARLRVVCIQPLPE